MRLFGLRLHVVLIVFALGLAVAFGGQHLYVQYQVEAPLAAEIGELEGVRDVTLETDAAGEYRVTVHLAPDVRLPEKYRAIRERIDARLGPGARLELADRRSPELEQAWDQMGFALQEGAATARLEAMRQRVQELAGERGVEARLLVDSEHIYVTLEKDGRYLHQVIGRQGGSQTGAWDSGQAGRGGA